MKKIRFIILLFVYFLTGHQVYSSSEFTTDYDNNYFVNENGQTIVEQNITLTNNLTNIFPRVFNLTLDVINISDISAYSVREILPVQKTVSDGKTKITVSFKNQIVGIGKKTSFTIKYTNDEIARKLGNIWEVNIPGAPDSPDLGNYNVKLNVPSVLGDPSYLKPVPNRNYFWTKDEITGKGISVGFGDHQLFRVNLDYSIENPHITSVVTEVALPPDTAFQKVEISRIDPRPQNIVKDKDGNWLAQYLIPANTIKNISADLIIATYINSRDDFKTPTVTGNEYLRPTRYWNWENEKIKTIAATNKSARQIYDFVVNNLSYNSDRITQNPARSGALAALTQKDAAVCMEFTDLFVAIARAAGIPSRQAIGYAYTTNSKLRPMLVDTDVLHSWPEYYDAQKNIWIPVDPTWGQTSGNQDYFSQTDFNHIVFAVNGIRDDYPYPAGSYKQNNKKGKTVQVNFADKNDFNPKTSSVSAEIIFPNKIYPGINNVGQLLIRNEGPSGVWSTSINIKSTPDYSNEFMVIDYIPPYSYYEIPLKFKTDSWLLNGSGEFNIKINDQNYSKQFKITALMHYILGLILIIISSIIYILWRRKVTS